MIELVLSIIGAVLIIYVGILVIAFLAGAFMHALDSIGQRADVPQPRIYSDGEEGIRQFLAETYSHPWRDDRDDN